MAIQIKNHRTNRRMVHCHVLFLEGRKILSPYRSCICSNLAVFNHHKKVGDTVLPPFGVSCDEKKINPGVTLGSTKSWSLTTGWRRTGVPVGHFQTVAGLDELRWCIFMPSVCPEMVRYTMVYPIHGTRQKYIFFNGDTTENSWGVDCMWRQKME